MQGNGSFARNETCADASMQILRHNMVFTCCRSSYPTPRILTPDCTPKVAEARVSDTVVWKTSQDSTAEEVPVQRKGPASSQASADAFQPLSELIAPEADSIADTHVRQMTAVFNRKVTSVHS